MRVERRECTRCTWIATQHSTPCTHTDLPRISVVFFISLPSVFEKYRQIVFARSVFYELNVRRGRNAYMKYCERGEDDNDSIFMFCELFLCALLSLSLSFFFSPCLSQSGAVFIATKTEQKKTSICEWIV